MELRKDPITRSWVVIREGELQEPTGQPCPFCPGNEHLTPPPLLTLPENGAPWQVRVFPHFDPVFRIEGDTGRTGEGIYDRMRAVGADEIIVELREHGRRLSEASEEEITRVFDAYAARLSDLKKDQRFKYVSVFKGVGVAGAQEAHSYAQVAATTFVPRRVLHELRSAREYYQLKERCLFCDVLQQELRQKVRILEATTAYVSLCPFASRTPYEVWLLPRRHHHRFEEDSPRPANRTELAGLLRRTLQRLEQVVEGYRLSLHTAPNTVASLGRIGYWKSLPEDFHWHIELIPLVAQKARPHLSREVYFTSVAPETAAARLRALPVRS
ncbi:MAG: galactose-1-phosphate uridylyltransferase [Candidatus Acidiferrales bacterium]